MNTAIFFLLRWERELELEREARGPDRRVLNTVEPPPQPRKPNLRRSAMRSDRRRACACPMTDPDMISERS